MNERSKFNQTGMNRRRLLKTILGSGLSAAPAAIPTIQVGPAVTKTTLTTTDMLAKDWLPFMVGRFNQASSDCFEGHILNGPMPSKPNKDNDDN